jgi:hypothetical protein
MSASDQMAIEAQNFRYGFLSAGLSDVLHREIGSSLSELESAQLMDAERFLSDVIAGVRLIGGGAPAAAIRHPMAALGRVLDPISAIDQFRSFGAPELLKLFDSIREFMHDSAARGRLDGNLDQLKYARVLFDALTQSILSYLQKQSRVNSDELLAPA